MTDVLVRIKRAILAGRFEFSEKATIEMECDALLESDVVECIVNASQITKTIRSKSIRRAAAREYLHIIISDNLEGLSIYTKGKLVGKPGLETYYFLISSKRSE